MQVYCCCLELEGVGGWEVVWGKQVKEKERVTKGRWKKRVRGEGDLHVCSNFCSLSLPYAWIIVHRNVIFRTSF